MMRFWRVASAGAQVLRELTIEVEASKTLTDNERVTNAKLNTMAVPNITFAGSAEPNQLSFAAWFVVTDSASVVNAYVGLVPDADSDPATLVDGMVLAFEIPATLTNTGSSTFQLKANDGTVIGSATIKKRGRDVVSGDLVAGQWIGLRYEAGSGFWQLQTVSQVEGADCVPGPYFVGTDNASTATAWVMQLTPAPASLVAGTKVRCAVPVSNTGALTLQIQTSGAVAVGSASAVQKLKGDGATGALAGGELRQGQYVELIYSGSVWIVISETGQAAVTVSRGLVVTNNTGTPNTIVDITADELVVRNLEGAARVLTTVSTSANIGTSGAGGLDTGAAASSTWYFIWVIVNAGGTISGLLSTSSTGPTLPSGYTHKALVGAVYRDVSNVFYSFRQLERKVWMRPTSVLLNKAAAGIDTYEALAGADLTAFRTAVPSIAKVVSGYMGSRLFGQNAAMAVAADANGLGEQILYLAAGGASDFAFWYSSGPFTVPCVAQTLFFKSVDTAGRNALSVTGWEF